MTKAEKSAYQKKWYQRNRERVLQRSRDYHRERYANDIRYREKKNQKDREWKQSDFGKQWCAAYSASRRTKETGYLSVEERSAILDLFGYKCCRCASVDSLEIDHLYPLSLGHPLTKGNAIVLCRSCNRKKYNKLPENFFTQEELDKIHEISS